MSNSLNFEVAFVASAKLLFRAIIQALQKVNEFSYFLSRDNNKGEEIEQLGMGWLLCVAHLSM